MGSVRGGVVRRPLLPGGLPVRVRSKLMSLLPGPDWWISTAMVLAPGRKTEAGSDAVVVELSGALAVYSVEAGLAARFCDSTATPLT